MFLISKFFLSGTVNFNHKHGCLRCTTVGIFDKKERHISFPNIDAPLRSDESFRMRIDEDHHKYKSPLEELKIDMVKDVIVADELHFLELGIMKKLITGWKNGIFKNKSLTKLSCQDIENISQLLVKFNKYMPTEFHRAVRSLDSLNFWKGLEYRSLLFYLGIVVFKDYLPEETYDHFLYLFCAVTICSNNEYLKYIDLVPVLVNEYIEKYIEIYGIDTISSNVHILCHLAEDVKRFGCLSEFSAYIFENFLGFLKHLIRQGNLPLEQACKRIVEMFNLKSFKDQVSKLSVKYRELRDGKAVYRQINTGLGFVINNTDKDKWFLSKQNDIVEAQYIIENDEQQYCIYGCSLKKKQNFFSKPFLSSNLNIYSCKYNKNLSKLYPINNIKCKLVCLKYHDELVFIPILHTNI